MGYHTEFNGNFEFDREISEELKNYINDFSNSRRMKRNVEKIKEIFPNWKDFTFNGELGTEGEFFARPGDDFGQEHDNSIIDYNCPPKTQPGLWCDWEISEDGKFLQWNESEKFYNYVEWLEYLINIFFIPEGYLLNGEVHWRGDDFDDLGIIQVINNKIKVTRFSF